MSSMEQRIKELEEKWAKEDQEKNEEELLDDALHGMETLIYASRSLKFEPGTNVTITELDDDKK